MGKPVRVLYSFPHKLGAGRICYTAWEQVRGVAAAGADVMVAPGVLHRALPPSVRVHPTLARGPVRIPYRLTGVRRACDMHDAIVARRLQGMRGQVDIVHAWPTGALRTLEVAASLGIPTVLERPNSHSRYAYKVVQDECDRIGVPLPPGSEHAFDADVLAREEKEYDAATRLLCPSEFVVRSFVREGFPPSRLVRHTYGFDESRFWPAQESQEARGGLTALFAGFCAVRKGLHLALEAWLSSAAHRDGTFFIAGEFLPAYKEKLLPLLAHPSVRMLGQRDDVPDLMRRADLLVLPSIEEGFGLVCIEAMASGSVPLVSNACTDICRHMENSLVHSVGDVAALASHFDLLRDDPTLLARLRSAAVATSPNFTWKAAGGLLLAAYTDTMQAYQDAHRA